MNYYLKAVKNFSFSGRATRTEFWMFELFGVAFAVITICADHFAGTCFKYDIGEGVKVLPFGYIFAIYALPTLVQTLAIHIRRLHDVGKSGWWTFAVLVPVIGAIYLLVLYCTGSTPGDNGYRADTEQQG